MYLQVKVHEEHTPLQRILWRSSQQEEIKHFELQRVTFGLTSSSFLATRVLFQLAVDEGERFPLGKRALQESYRKSFRTNINDPDLENANTLMSFNFPKADFAKMDAMLRDVDWSFCNPDCTTNCDLNTAIRSLTDKLISIFAECCPLKTASRKRGPPWSNRILNNIRRSKNRAKRRYKRTRLPSDKLWLNTITSHFRQVNKLLYNDYIQNLQSQFIDYYSIIINLILAIHAQ